MQIHVVKKGETLTSISRDYKTSIRQISGVNQLPDPNKLIIGQALIIPAPSGEYTVQRGDNLWSIAQTFGTSVQSIAEANQISDPSVIYEGQLLFIPSAYYIVQTGDTLWKIARLYNVSIQNLIELNRIADPSKLVIGQILRIPDKTRSSDVVNAYLNRIDRAGVQAVQNYGPYLTYISPFGYSITKTGTFTALADEEILEAARSERTAPLMVLTNYANNTFDSDLAAAILRNTNLQNQLITNILTTLKQKGYTGLNFDFEYIYPEDRENYNQFLRLVVSRLHPEGYTVSTVLAPKVSAAQKGILYEAHDYQAHGEIVDFVILMTYEWGWAGGSPLAIAPLNEVKRVLDYAVTVIPPAKILMGIPLYARDWKIPWKQGTLAQTVSPQAALQLAFKYGTSIQYNTVYQSPFFRYTDETGQQHEVWFEDARSIQAKLDTIKQYKLLGASYWELSSPFPQNWAIQESNLKVVKY